MPETALADYELYLPYVEWKNRDWKAAIHAADGLEKRLLQMQEIAVHALAGVDPKPLTPAKLAWSVLWARGFCLLQGARDLYGAPAARLLDGLHRMAFELWLQVEAIRRPWDDLKRMQTRSPGSVTDERLAAAWLDVADRLRGFAAWALTNDLRFYRNRAAGWELHAVFHKTDPESFPKTAEELVVHRYLFGDIDVISEGEAKLDRERARAAHERTISRLEGWLADPAFGHWREDLDPWISGREREVLSLFQLLDSSTASPKRLLQDIGAAHLYGVYSRGSMILHGSSISHYVTVGSGGTRAIVIPLVVTSEEESEPLCAHLADSCNSAILGLWGMRDTCL